MTERERPSHSSPIDDEDNATFNCFELFDPHSLEAEYDETLGIDGLDEVTVVTVGGEEVVIKKTNIDAQQVTEIPYTCIFSAPQKFNQKQRKLYLSGIEIKVEISDYERSVTHHLLNPNLYTINLTHGQFKWQIKKRYKDFQSLHQQLMIFKTSLNIPFPSKAHRDLRNSFRAKQKEITSSETNKDETQTDLPQAQNDKKTKKRVTALPRFPQKPEALVPYEALTNRMKQLEEYLKNLLAISIYRYHPETVDFLQVSPLSFVAALGGKGKEGYLSKRSGSTRPSQRGCDIFGCCGGDCCFRMNQFCSTGICSRWRNCWFFVKDTFFGYIRPNDGVIRCIGLFDQGFDVSSGVYSTGMRHGIQLYNHSRFIMLRGSTRRSTKEWLEYIKHVAHTHARKFVDANPYYSYAPTRLSVSAGWFVDGCSYMSCVADALERAQEEIYIADWWLSPEIYMKRPAVDGVHWRLDKILKRKAEQGVKIFVLLFKEVEMALGINSYYSKNVLVKLHENIKVLRHPDHAKVGVFLWAHHEKLVIIDQTYAFVGGIDLCYGRWDDHHHRLTDLGSVNYAEAVANTQRLFSASIDTVDSSTPLPGKRPNVQLNLNFEDQLMNQQAQLTSDSIPEKAKMDTPEMERRRFGFTDSLVAKSKDFMNRLTDLTPTQEEKHDKRPPKDQDIENNIAYNRDEMQTHKIEDPAKQFENKLAEELEGQAKLWIGKDYCNFIIKDFVNLNEPHDDFVDRATTARMPWHDVATVVVGSAARDIARHFIQRWNATKLEKANFNNSFPYLMPRTYQEIRFDPNVITIPLHRVSVQALRSSSSWSTGFLDPDYVEQSIHEAYIETITKAQHYIYIENQFFISMERGNVNVKNTIAERLFERIIRARREKKVFRVFVVMPLLPGFEGDVGGTGGIAIRAITHWNYSSICRGKYSLISRLTAAGIQDPFEYITFHSLRTHSTLQNQPITELIYVHSKLLIADDRVVICGSANINDRSLIGKRDSEVAVIITDEQFEEGRMNGDSFPSGFYAGRLRKFLFREHLGLLEPDMARMNLDITDPIIDGFYNGIWRRTSYRNTKIFDEVFKCIPTDEVANFTALKAYQESEKLCKTNCQQAEQEIKRIEGHLVDLPLKFLKDEVLTPPSTSKEGIMPTSLWT